MLIYSSELAVAIIISRTSTLLQWAMHYAAQTANAFVPLITNRQLKEEMFLFEEICLSCYLSERQNSHYPSMTETQIVTETSKS